MFRNSIMGTTNSVPREAWLATEHDKLQYQREKDEREREEREKEKKISIETKLRARQAVVHFAEYMHHCHDCPSWMMVFPGNRERCSDARLALLNSGVDLAFNDVNQNDMVQMVKNMK